MPAAVDQCPAGHDTRTRADRDSQGHCRKCKADRDKRIRAGNSAALTVVRAFEAAGVQFQADGIPVDPAEVARQLGELWASGALDPS